MPRNLEVKARIRSVREAEQTARSINATFEGTLHQVDTYYNVPRGRLKSREINNERAELIFYERDEHAKHRESNYRVFPCMEISLLKEILGRSLGIRATVKKKRELFMYNSTRIHLDEVENLGSFLELESPVEESLDKAQEVVAFLVREFNVQDADFVLESYVDLLTSKDTRT
ncbi:MAG: class IV adenylate cyclase [Bacteroidota bacterium]|jgi:predicted adenylyl cyclase CyaB